MKPFIARNHRFETKISYVSQLKVALTIQFMFSQKVESCVNHSASENHVQKCSKRHKIVPTHLTSPCAVFPKLPDISLPLEELAPLPGAMVVTHRVSPIFTMVFIHICQIMDSPKLTWTPKSSKNGGLQDDVPFRRGDFLGSMLVFRGVSSTLSDPRMAKSAFLSVSCRSQEKRILESNSPEAGSQVSPCDLL